MDRSELGIALICCAGWGWEARSIVQDVCNKGLLRPSSVTRAKDRRLLDELLAGKDSKRLKLIADIRNQHFGHFDVRVARSFLRRPSEERSGVFYETTDKGRFLESRHTWAYEAMMSKMFSTPFDKRLASELIGQVSEFATCMLHILRTIVEGMMGAMQLKLEPATAGLAASA